METSQVRTHIVRAVCALLHAHAMAHTPAPLALVVVSIAVMTYPCSLMAQCPSQHHVLKGTQIECRDSQQHD